jgi:hypothetical protein
MSKGGGDPPFIVLEGNLPIGMSEDRTSLVNIYGSWCLRIVESTGLDKSDKPLLKLVQAGLVWFTELVRWGIGQV